MLIRFCLNPVSIDRHGRPIPGGQVDRMMGSVVRHLDAAGADYSFGRQPIEGAVNVYFTHRDSFAKVRREVGVFVSHGIADKGWRNNTGSYYRATFVSGPSWTLKLLDHQCPPHVIFEVGYPKLDDLIAARADRTRNERPVVVWAPTHGGGGDHYASKPPKPENAPMTFNALRSSWWHRDEVLGLLDRFDVIEAPHPRHRPDRQATYAEYLIADVVVADGGSTIYEAMALDIPVVFPSWLTMQGCTEGNSVATTEQHIYQNGIGRHAHAPGELAQLVDEAWEHGITAAEQSFIEPILPRRYRGIGGRLHAETLLDLAGGVASPRHCAPVEWDEFRFTGGRVRRVARGTKDHARLSAHRSWVRL